MQDSKPCYYVYAQTMDGRTQYGLVLCAHTDDYSEGKIKKHELTRPFWADAMVVPVNSVCTMVREAAILSFVFII